MNGKGYVYAIENNGKVKIGSTINPKSRLRNIQTQGGFISANIYLSNQLYAYQDLEILIHKNLGDFRDIGEWFNVDFDSACKEIEDGYKQLKSSDQEAKKKEIALSAGSAIAMIAEKLIAEGNSRNAAIVQMSQASWTSEAMDFVLSKPQGAIDIILGVLFMCPTVTIIDGDDFITVFSQTTGAETVSVKLSEVEKFVVTPVYHEDEEEELNIGTAIIKQFADL